MLTLSHILGYVLAATVFWLLWVLNETSSFSVAFYVGLGALIMTLLFWKGRKYPKIKRLNWVLILLMLAVPLISTPDSQIKPYVQEHWGRFRPELILNLVQQGKVVVVDITASWCLTCKINKTFVLDSKEGERLLVQKDVVLMRADWTRQDPILASYLASYGRAGIPFNVVFGPHAQTGIVLPEILNLESLKNALTQARGEK